MAKLALPLWVFLIGGTLIREIGLTELFLQIIQ
jgi:hypothetical protein